MKWKVEWKVLDRTWTGPGGAHGRSYTFNVLRQDLPRAGVLDTVSTPGREELEQPGRRRAGDGALQAAAAQDNQVFLRVQAAGDTHATVSQPQDDRCFQPESKHPSRTAGNRRETHAETPKHRDGEIRWSREQLLAAKGYACLAQRTKTVEWYLTLVLAPETKQRFLEKTHSESSERLFPYMMWLTPKTNSPVIHPIKE